MPSDEEPPFKEDILDVAQRALNRANEAHDELEDLRFRVMELEQYAPDSDAGYDDLDRDERVGRVRQRLIERARERRGRAAFDYNDILLVFDDEPARGTAYKLMERAQHASGFDIRDPPNGNRELVVNLDEVRTAAGVSRVKTSAAEGGR